MPQNHVNARQLYYPDSTITRFPVPEEKVSWEVPDFNYTLTGHVKTGLIFMTALLNMLKHV